MYVLDTDIAVEYLRGNETVVERLWKLSEIGMTMITVAELFYGVCRSQNTKKHEAKLKDMIDGANLLGIDELSCRVFGAMKAKVNEKGKSVDDFDVMIASICIANDCTLITRNLRHFKEFEGLRIETI